MKNIQLRRVHAMPKQLEAGFLYVSTEFEVAGHLCACGCGEKVITPLGAAAWSFEDEGGRPTLYPSIGNWQLPCRSHYWITRGEIDWAAQWTEDQIHRGRRAEEERRREYYESREVRDFPVVQQDRNAFNSGDCVKFVFADAVEAFLKIFGSATLVDSHAGAGAYPARNAGPVAKDDGYYSDMQRTLPAIPFTVGGEAVRFLGVGPMLLRRHRSLKYVGFEKNGKAHERINATLAALQTAHAVSKADGWEGTTAYIASSPVQPLIVFLDPFTYARDLSDLNEVLSSVGSRSQGPALLGMFVPGTLTSHQPRTWLDWKAVDDCVRKWASGVSWTTATFSLRKGLSAKKLDPHGRVQHFSLLVASSHPEPIQEAKAAWTRRSCDKSFARWSKLT